VRDIAGILLAAGRSERFGGHKLLTSLPDGTLLAVRAAHTLKRALPRVLAVIRPGDTALSRCFQQEGLEVLECPEAERGMGHSLAAGVAALADAGAWLVALADMPFIGEPTCRRIVQAIADGAELAVPVYRGRRGHPVGFSAVYRDRLLALDGDRGARDLLAANVDRLRLIEVDDPGILRDVDSPDDLQDAVTS